MAIEFNINAAHKWFAGEDKIFEFQMFDADGVTPLDVSSYGFEWILRRTDADRDILIRKSTDPSGGMDIVGSVPDQRVIVTIASDDTKSLKAFTYRHSIRRTDDGSKLVFTFGDATLRQATTR